MGHILYQGSLCRRGSLAYFTLVCGWGEPNPHPAGTSAAGFLTVVLHLPQLDLSSSADTKTLRQRLGSPDAPEVNGFREHLLVEDRLVTLRAFLV